MIQMELDGVAFALKERFDFGFLAEYGKVFQVLDDQDSGNICFGMQKGDERFFIKFAGALTKRGCVPPETAIRNLKATVPIYQELKHENLIELLETADAGGGFAMIFRWTDAVCLGKLYPESRERFLQLPIEIKQQVFQDIQSFFLHVAQKGYVAIDFYDGSIMYDFASGKTLICDIDFFRRQPCLNDMGRMWGSSRFQSPEEYQLGADIDEVTNVYTLGATAFALFAHDSRQREDWPLNDALFETAAKAVSNEREKRFPSIAAFVHAWKEAMNVYSKEERQ